MEGDLSADLDALLRATTHVAQDRSPLPTPLEQLHELRRLTDYLRATLEAQSLIRARLDVLIDALCTLVTTPDDNP